MHETLILVAGILAIPLLLLALRSAFAWRYGRMLRSGMSRSAGPPADVAHLEPTPIDVDRPPLTVLRVHASGVRLHSSSAIALNDDAKGMTRRARLAITVAALIYSAIASSTLAAAFLPTIPLDAKAVAIYLSQACIPLIVVSILQLGPSRLALIVGAYLVVGLAVIFALSTPSRIALLVRAEAELSLLLPAIGLALLVVRRLRPLLIALAAVLLYVAMSAVIGVILAETVTIDLGNVRPWVWVLAVLNFIAGIVVVGWLLGRPSVRVPVLVLASLAVIGVVLEFTWRPAFPIPAILYAVPASALQVFLVWLMFRLVLRLQDLRVLTAQVLQSHIAFGFLTLYSGDVADCRGRSVFAADLACSGDGRGVLRLCPRFACSVIPDVEATKDSTSQALAVSPCVRLDEGPRTAAERTRGHVAASGSGRPDCRHRSGRPYARVADD